MYILLVILSITSAFACDPGAISIVRRSGISSNNNGNHSGNTSQKVNVPVNFEGKWGCWEQDGGLSFDVKDKTRSISVIIPKSSFNNLPGRTVSYASLRKNDAGIVEMDIATFVCAGNNVMSSETFSGNVHNAIMLQSMDVRVSSTFATGVAAAALNDSREEMARRFGRRTELTQGLQKYFEDNFAGNFSVLEKYELFIPSIYLGLEMKTPLATLKSSYNTKVLTKAACSPEFEAVMAPLRFENLRIPEGMKTKVKKGNLIISW